MSGNARGGTMTPDFTSYLEAHLSFAKGQSGTNRKARCPRPELHAHGDKNPSLSVDNDRGLLKCFGCGLEGNVYEVARELGWEDPPQNGNGFRGRTVAPAQGKARVEINPDHPPSTWRGHPITCNYRYENLDGSTAFFVARVEYTDTHGIRRKEFPQYAHGGWGRLKEKGVKPVLFHLPQVLASTGDLFVVEGEKDVAALEQIGFTATTSPGGGGGKWKPEYSETLRGKNVTILPDNDEPGRKHAAQVASSLVGIAASVKVLELPGLPGAGDVSDWLAGKDRLEAAEELSKFVDGVHEWRSEQLDAALSPAADVETSSAKSPKYPAELAKIPNPTDSGNGEFFAARNGRDVRFDHKRGRYLLWHGHRWQPDVDAEIRRLAKAAMRQRFKDAAALDDPDARSRAAKWAIASESRARLDALLYCAQAEPPIADAGDGWDRDPMLLGAPNGVIDLRSGEMRPGRREDRITMSTAVPFDPRAECPRFMRFLSEIFGLDALVAFIQRAVGYSLTGLTSEQCLFICYGTGANGKGSFTKAIGSVFGDYAYAMPFSTVELHQRSAIPNDLAALVSPRFVTASETNDGTRLNEARIKALTGCDPITARFLHAEFFTFEPVAKFWLSVNHRPVVRDDSHAFWRRIRLIPFTRTFPVNATLADELRAEAPGILAWAVRGALVWQRDGLNAPAVVLEATSEYEKDSDPLAAFLDEACSIDAQAETGAGDLYQHYKRWADQHSLSDRERLTATAFGRKISERFTHQHTRSGRVYIGLSRRTLDQPVTPVTVGAYTASF